MTFKDIIFWTLAAGIISFLFFLPEVRHLASLTLVSVIGTVGVGVTILNNA